MLPTVENIHICIYYSPSPASFLPFYCAAGVGSRLQLTAVPCTVQEQLLFLGVKLKDYGDVGTCWLLEPQTMPDLGWNLSAAADKRGRLALAEGSKGGVRF